MITDQKGLEQGDNVLISEIHRGFSYQLAAALSRLGRKMIGLIPEKSLAEDLKVLQARSVVQDFKTHSEWKKHPLLSLDYSISTFVMSFHDSLTRGVLPSESEWQNALSLCHALQDLPEPPQIIGLFPKSFPDNYLTDFLSIHPQKTTLFLCPKVFGFRDEYLFDFLNSLNAQERSRLSKKMETSDGEELSFVGDLVGFVLSALGDKKHFSRVVQVPPTFLSVQELTQAFTKHCPVSRTTFEQLKDVGSFLQANPMELFLKNHQPLPASTSSTLTKNSQLLARAENALEVFPTLLSKPERIFSQSLQYIQRDPLLKSHFPPGRAL